MQIQIDKEMSMHNKETNKQRGRHANKQTTNQQKTNRKKNKNHTDRKIDKQKIKQSPLVYSFIDRATTTGEIQYKN